MPRTIASTKEYTAQHKSIKESFKQVCVRDLGWPKYSHCAADEVSGGQLCGLQQVAGAL